MQSHHRHEISNTVYTGATLAEANRAMILVHGRGASADDILTLEPHLRLEGFALVAPQATGHTWYPYSFLAPQRQNEPGLSSGMDLIGQLIEQCMSAGISPENVYLLGFSQGACLTLEYAARNARPFGGIFALSGGLIGDTVNISNYRQGFEGTPIFLGCSDIDPHIPLERVEETAMVLKVLGARVHKEIYPNLPHTIIQAEIDAVNDILAKAV